MKTIGLLGGMSWQSTVSYYQAINHGVAEALGGLHSAKVNLVSVDFADIEKLQHQGKWQETTEILAVAAQNVERSGADCLLICTNTMHKVAEQVQSAIDIPLIHIADATGQQLVDDHVTKVGLLGTAFTMSESFYKGRLTETFGLEVIVPNDERQQTVHQIIYDELCHGNIIEASKKSYLEIIEALRVQGAQAIILGCTEIALLISDRDTELPLYDTVAIHAQAAVNFALDNNQIR
ncbi:aspartate/glutamate racemase family protein [Endozoicomonas sp. G2_1]|uniref:aspartate/glutamate racemase family protein n=1 Tax=Endozoicomonas sp. G2_1 TaxID=2821091 RepID=UPI001ADB6A41|nr:aspartate/glutamate racemase family protein [Endozoicomonas sp. G2_1]MBO9490648.1 aspartate/glutamate racemase family protein [Endozoicomonas sp. G2_1]